jgi:hypothetical protein
MKYTATRISSSVWNITSGRAKVGTIVKTAEGWTGRLGETRVTATTSQAAFDAVVARANGLSGAAELRQHNAAARQIRAESRARAQDAVLQLRDHGNIDPLLDFIQKSCEQK